MAKALLFRIGQNQKHRPSLKEVKMQLRCLYHLSGGFSIGDGLGREPIKLQLSLGVMSSESAA